MTDGSGLGGDYGATIAWIKTQDEEKSRLGMAALIWISHAQRQLKADELCHALAVELGFTDFNICNIPWVLTLVSCCQGLIAVDKEASTVRLIHFALQEYLPAHPDICSRPHSAMAGVCLTYLSSQQVKALSASPSPDTGNTPFPKYCSMYWGVHAKRELSDCARSLALGLLKGNYGQTSTEFLLARVGDWRLSRFGVWFPFSGLHCASFFGINEVVAGLTEMGCYDIDGGDFSGYTPLAWATHAHEDVVKILLGSEEVNPDKPDNNSETPLSHTARGGHEGVVKLLLKQEEVNPDKPNKWGQTPLSYAASRGHEGVVKILLEQAEVNPNKSGNNGWTPLTQSAMGEHEGVVKILLERQDVNPDKLDYWGRTPLSYAAEREHEGVVKILLEREEVNPDKPSISSLTPLSLATKNGHERVVALPHSRKAAVSSTI